MRMAVIGASGRIGSRIVAEALGHGYEMTAVVRDWSRVDDKPHQIAEADVFDQAAIAAAVAGTDVVINAAGHAAQLDDADRATRAARSMVAALHTLDRPPHPRGIARCDSDGPLQTASRCRRPRPTAARAIRSGAFRPRAELAKAI